MARLYWASCGDCSWTGNGVESKDIAEADRDMHKSENSSHSVSIEHSD